MSRYTQRLKRQQEREKQLDYFMDQTLEQVRPLMIRREVLESDLALRIKRTVVESFQLALSLIPKVPEYSGYIVDSEDSNIHFHLQQQRSVANYVARLDLNRISTHNGPLNTPHIMTPYIQPNTEEELVRGLWNVKLGLRQGFDLFATPEEVAAEVIENYKGQSCQAYSLVTSLYLMHKELKEESRRREGE